MDSDHPLPTFLNQLLVGTAQLPIRLPNTPASQVYVLLFYRSFIHSWIHSFMHSFIYLTYWSNYYCLYAHGHSLKNGQLPSVHKYNKRICFPTKPSAFSSSSPTEAEIITFCRSFFSF